MRAASTIVGLSGLFLFSPGARAQTPAKEEFEVAAVKPFTPNGPFPLRTVGGPGTSDPVRITYEHLSFEDLLMAAYGLKRYQISGPAWLGAQRYIIEATIRPGATKEQANRMLQNLLANRFKLTLHRENKELPVHDLVVAKNGPKLKESQDDPAVRPSIYGSDHGKDGSPSSHCAKPNRFGFGHLFEFALIRPGAGQDGVDRQV